MIREHEEIMCDISLLLTDILSSSLAKFSVKYLDHEVSHHVLEVFILNDTLSNKKHKRFLNEIKKFDFVTHIYTLDEGKLYTILLKPIEDIRSFKINKLQKKITK
jgi:hypothetical protein